MTNTTLGRSIRRLLAPPAAGLAILALAGAVHAGGGVAYSTIQISNLVLTNEATGEVIGLENFTSIEGGDTVSGGATLDGASINTARTRDLSVAGGLSPEVADLPLQCVGPDCGGISENDFDRQNIGGDPGNFARADGLLQGAFLDIEDLGPAEASQVTEVQLNRTGAGETDSRISNDSEFTFTPGTDFDEGVTFSFDAFADLYAVLFQDDFIARADHSFDLNLTGPDGELLLRFSPDELNRSVSVLSEREAAPGAIQESFTANSGALVGGEQYTLSLVTTTSADLRVQVPEPASVALFGLGLLALGGTLYRRRSQGQETLAA